MVTGGAKSRSGQMAGHSSADPALHGFSHVRLADSADQDFPAHLKEGVVAIGNFDGVHLGHMAVLDCALQIARTASVPAIVLTFEPHPRTLFRPDQPVFRLTPAPVKVSILRDLGFDAVIEQTFDRKFAQIPASLFVSRLLGEVLSVTHVVTGHDFHFGKDRQGTPKFLADRGLEMGISVTLVQAQHDSDGEIISSTRIREALAEGDIALANRLSGRPWFVRGVVIAGKKLGRTLGYPTVNLLLPEETTLRHGIYAIRARLGDGSVLNGVASYGRRPTFDNGEALLEAFLFDYSGDLYGTEIEIAFFGFLRGEEKFDSARSLIRQMERDSKAAQAILERV